MAVLEMSELCGARNRFYAHFLIQKEKEKQLMKNAYSSMHVCQGLGGGTNFPFLKESQKPIWPEHGEGWEEWVREL